MDPIIILYIFLLLVGLVLIIKGGDWFVDAASWIAKVSGIPTFVIGATIVSLATTLPEILVSTIGTIQEVCWPETFKGSIDLAVGNAIGSVNANLALIMGISLAFLPGTFSRKDHMPKALILIGGILLLALCCFLNIKNGMPFWWGIIIFLVFIVFIVENLIYTKRKNELEKTLDTNLKTSNAEIEKPKKEKYKPKNAKEVWKNIIFFILGAAGIAGGAILLSTYGQKIAVLAGVPASIIGVTIIAVGTSLPELTTTIIAIRKKQSDLSVGNIVGANIIDITLILPLCSFIAAGKGNLPINSQTIILDIPFCFLVAATALVPAIISKKFRRWQGITLLGLYVCYLTVLILSALNIFTFPKF